MPRAKDSTSPVRLIALLCAAKMLVQIGAFFWPALLPEMIARWRLTNSEAGWITAAFYGAYVLAVPILVTLTDRIDAKRVYLGGVAAMILGHALFAALADGFWSALAARALTGIGWAGTYMTGLKLLADKVDARTLSRAAARHAASIGISSALSYVCADLLASAGGWRFAFAAAAASAVVAWLVVMVAIPPRVDTPQAMPAGPALFDFRPVLRNRSAPTQSRMASTLWKWAHCAVGASHIWRLWRSAPDVQHDHVTDRRAHSAGAFWNARKSRRQ